MELAYLVQNAYRTTNNRNDAVARVAPYVPDIETKIIEIMWDAIDAYEDMKDEEIPEIG